MSATPISNKQTATPWTLPIEPRQVTTRDTVSTEAKTADNLLRSLARRATCFDRNPANNAGDTAALLLKAQDSIAEAVLELGMEKSIISGLLARAVIINGGMSAATIWYEGLKLGIEKINEAQRKAQAYGVRAHMARGLSQTLALATKRPSAPLSDVKQRAVAQARKLYLAQAAADYYHRKGKQLSKDRIKRDERFTGLRKGIELALSLLSPLSGSQRRQLGELVRREGDGSIDDGFRRIARPAVGADSIHATRR